MKLSEFHKKIETAGDIHAFTAYLAAPDKDGLDVDLAAVGRVEVDYETGDARLYPASTTTDVDAIEPEPYLGMILDELPIDVSGETDLNLLAEVPILREDAGGDRVHLVELAGVHVGKGSEEVWLLVVPASEFAAGLLPD